MAEEHPIVEDLLRYREVEKLRSTYADALPPLIRSDGRIHATFKQTDTTTGRISSEAPNLQNVPVRTADGREIRSAFIADEGSGLLTADYSQIELRVLAHLADDPGLIDAFERGADVHTATAATVFHVPEADVDDAQRRFAKVVNYGLAYGMEAYGLGQRLGIPTGEAAKILDAYFAGFPNVKAYMAETVREAKERGYTTTIFGRRRQITELASDNFRIRQMGERMAQNAPVQGSAADVFKLAMIQLDHALDEAGCGARHAAHRARRARARGAPRRARADRDDRARGDGVTSASCACRSSSTSASAHLGRREVVERAHARGRLVRAGSRGFSGRRTSGTSFTKGTEQEVGFLVEALALERGCGCSTWVAARDVIRSRSHGAGSRSWASTIRRIRAARA